MVGVFIIHGSSTAATNGIVPNFAFTLYQGDDEWGAEKLQFASH